nr:hypothetical protein [Tanacetum cinerariifolium]
MKNDLRDEIASRKGKSNADSSFTKDDEAVKDICSAHLDEYVNEMKERNSNALRATSPLSFSLKVLVHCDGYHNKPFVVRGSYAHLDDSDNNDGGCDNDDDGSNNVEKEKEPAGEAAVNAEKRSVFNSVLGLDAHACLLVYIDGCSANVDLNTY